MAILCLRGSSNVSIKEIILSAFSGLISKESSAKKICRPTSAAAGVLSPTGSKGLISFFSSGSAAGAVSAAGTFSASCTAAAFSGALAVSSAAGTETSVLAGSTLAAGSISAAAGFETSSDFGSDKAFPLSVSAGRTTSTSATVSRTGSRSSATVIGLAGLTGSGLASARG